MVAGWYDLFLPDQLRDFQRVRAAGNEARILIGPWNHGDPASVRPMITDQADFLAAHLLGDRAALRRPPVRAYLQQSGHWLDFEEWPPKSTGQRLYLPGLNEAPGSAQPDEFLYDPADSTPSVGGPLLVGKAKQRDNRAVEVRPDVLVYTGEPLTEDLDVVGEPAVSVWVRTDRANADVFVRLCDVDPGGVSRNVTEGIVRLRERADGPIEPALFATAYRFRRGHRLRVQVAGGTGQPVAGAVAVQRCHFQILHDEEHPSYLTLPILAE
jgi:putative CocE/NonD family hydrolase